VCVDRTDITLRPHRRAVRGHAYRSLAETKVARSSAHMPCPCRISTDAGGTVRPGSFCGASRFGLGSTRKAIQRAGHLGNPIGNSSEPVRLILDNVASALRAETAELFGGERGFEPSIRV